MRLNDRCRIFETVLTSSVLANPGTPSRMQWPRLNKAINNCSTTSAWPTMILPICSVMRSQVEAKSRTAWESTAELVVAGSLTGRDNDGGTNPHSNRRRLPCNDLALAVAIPTNRRYPGADGIRRPSQTGARHDHSVFPVDSTCWVFTVDGPADVCR